MSTAEENRGQPARMEFAAGGLVGTCKKNIQPLTFRKSPSVRP